MIPQFLIDAFPKFSKEDWQAFKMIINHSVTFEKNRAAFLLNNSLYELNNNLKPDNHRLYNDLDNLIFETLGKKHDLRLSEISLLKIYVSDFINNEIKRCNDIIVEALNKI